jgi:hypothetical protein
MWVAKQAKKEDPIVRAMQAKITKLEKTMKKDGSKQHADKTCFHCQKKGHISPNCPDKDKPKVESTGEKKDDKDKKSKSPVRTPPKEGEPHTKTVDGTVMKWCKKCGRWTKGDKMHSTEEHKPKNERGGSTGNGEGATAGIAPVAGAAGIQLVPRAYGMPAYCKVCYCSGYHSPEKCPKTVKRKEEVQKIQKQVTESATYAQAVASDYLSWMTSKDSAGPSC